MRFVFLYSVTDYSLDNKLKYFDQNSAFKNLYFTNNFLTWRKQQIPKLKLLVQGYTFNFAS